MPRVHAVLWCWCHSTVRPSRPPRFLEQGRVSKGKPGIGRSSGFDRERPLWRKVTGFGFDPVSSPETPFKGDGRIGILPPRGNGPSDPRIRPNGLRRIPFSLSGGEGSTPFLPSQAFVRAPPVDTHHHRATRPHVPTEEEMDATRDARRWTVPRSHVHEDALSTTEGSLGNGY